MAMPAFAPVDSPPLLFEEGAAVGLLAVTVGAGVVGTAVAESVSTTADSVAEAWKQAHALLTSAAWKSDM